MAVSHINESVIFEEVMNTHHPDGKENFKISVIFDLVKSILYPIMIRDSIDEDEDFDKEDSNGDESDEKDTNDDESDDDKKSNEEESDSNKRSDDEKEFDSEEEYSKDMELPYQLKQFSFEVELHLLKNRSLLLLISSILDIDKDLILTLKIIQNKTKLYVLWIPILDDSSTLWDMEEQYKSLVNKFGLLSVRNLQKSIASGFVRFVKEKLFPTFQIGGEPIIVSLDHNGRMVHRNAMHMLLMRGFEISERMSGGVKTGDSITPLLRKVLMERVSTVRDLVPGIDRKISEVAHKVDGIITDWLYDIQKQIRNPVDSNIYTSEREKDLWKIETWCTKLVLEVFGHYRTKMWVDDNRCFFLIGGHDIQWVKTFESKVMLQNQFNPQSTIKMLYVGSNMKVASMIAKDKDCKILGLSAFTRFFSIRLRSIFMSRIKFVEETHGDEECDEILARLKKLLAYETNDFGGEEWAMLCKGNKIVVCDIGDKMLKVMNEYEKWKENAIAKGFDQAFKDHHEKMLHSTSQHYYPCAFEFPSNFDNIPENVKCLQCYHDMQKFITFKCYHGKVDDDDEDSD